jgi:hypothetical protein
VQSANARTHQYGPAPGESKRYICRLLAHGGAAGCFAEAATQEDRGLRIEDRKAPPEVAGSRTMAVRLFGGGFGFMIRFFGFNHSTLGGTKGLNGTFSFATCITLIEMVSVYRIPNAGRF